MAVRTRYIVILQFVSSNLHLSAGLLMRLYMQVLPAQAAQGEEGKRPDPGLQRGVPAVRFVVELRLFLYVHNGLR